MPPCGWRPSTWAALRCTASSSSRRWPIGAASISAWICASGRARRWCAPQPLLLDALIANLVDNALRYTQEAGRVTVGVQRDGMQLVLWIEDDGPGIAAEDRERVFERFYRVSQHTEGSGLGLAIVREIALSFGAGIELADPAQGAPGLTVSVRFAAADR